MSVGAVRKRMNLTFGDLGYFLVPVKFGMSTLDYVTQIEDTNRRLILYLGSVTV